ncbi:hypothetical protein [Rubrivirga sp.]|uniref:hypothetical protein n=1 Tax=Rubrivirga sp. TaxID=1885344 RepID=UPI003C75E180
MRDGCCPLHFQVLRQGRQGRGTPANLFRLFERSEIYGDEPARSEGVRGQRDLEA